MANMLAIMEKLPNFRELARLQ